MYTHICVDVLFSSIGVTQQQHWLEISGRQLSPACEVAEIRLESKPSSLGLLFYFKVQLHLAAMCQDACLKYKNASTIRIL